MVLFWWPGGTFVAMSEFRLGFEEEHSLPSYCVLYSTQRSLQFRQKRLQSSDYKTVVLCKSFWTSTWVFAIFAKMVWIGTDIGADSVIYLRTKFPSLALVLVITFWESLTNSWKVHIHVFRTLNLGALKSWYKDFLISLLFFYSISLFYYYFLVPPESM